MISLGLTDEQLKLMLEILATHHMVLYLKNEDNINTERLIQVFNDGLVKIGKEEIFSQVYREFKGKHE